MRRGGVVFIDNLAIDGFFKHESGWTWNGVHAPAFLFRTNATGLDIQEGIPRGSY